MDGPCFFFGSCALQICMYIDEAALPTIYQLHPPSLPFPLSSPFPPPRRYCMAHTRIVCTCNRTLCLYIIPLSLCCCVVWCCVRTLSLSSLTIAVVVNWTTSGHEVIFLSEEAIFNGAKAIRGGIPLVFPQVTYCKKKIFRRLNRSESVQKPAEVEEVVIGSGMVCTNIEKWPCSLYVGTYLRQGFEPTYLRQGFEPMI